MKIVSHDTQVTPTYSIFNDIYFRKDNVLSVLDTYYNVKRKLILY